MNIDKEFRSLIPPLTAEEYRGLEQSILAEGCRDALITWNDTLIDGHNRHEICTKHGVLFKTSEKTFESREKAKEWIILNQFSRRNLSAYDRSVLALRLRELFVKKAKENQRLATGGDRKSEVFANQGCQKSDKVDFVNPLCKTPEKPEHKPIDTKKELASIAGVSHDTITKVQKIEEKATPEVKEKIKSGEVSINQAYQTVRREEKIQAVEQKIEEHKEKPTGITDIYTTNKKYSIIYADPAWDYNEWPAGTRNPHIHYRCMPVDDICNLPIGKISDDNCILFLWVTCPMLQDSFKVIESWGFKYKTVGFVWVKKNKNIDTPFIGCGSWTRANSELCLIATKGNITRLDASISQIIESPIDEHSKKPAITRGLITRLVGELPRIELFSRQAIEGWDSWGNEI